MDNYIIRIYRREGNDPAKVTGIVEEVGTDDRKVFKSPDELWNILNRGEEGESEINKKMNCSG